MEGELYVTLEHPMTKEHFISFLARSTSDCFALVKLYPKGGARERFPLPGGGMLYCTATATGCLRKSFCERSRGNKPFLHCKSCAFQLESAAFLN